MLHIISSLDLHSHEHQLRKPWRRHWRWQKPGRVIPTASCCMINQQKVFLSQYRYSPLTARILLYFPGESASAGRIILKHISMGMYVHLAWLTSIHVWNSYTVYLHKSPLADDWGPTYQLFSLNQDKEKSGMNNSHLLFSKDWGIDWSMMNNNGLGGLV